MSVVNMFDVFDHRPCAVTECDGCAQEEARPRDVGDHPLMRGLVTALPSVRPRLSLSYCGRRRCRPQSVRREFLCRGLAPTCAQQVE